MKNYCLLIMMALLMAGKMEGQATRYIPTNLTPNGIFDSVSDRFGKRFALADMHIASAKPLGSTNTISTVPTESCNAGYYRLFFDPTSIFCVGTQSAQAQTIMCEVFSSLSSFIISPLSFTGNKVNIFCTGTSNPGLLASASSNYLFPASFPTFMTNVNQGYIDGMVYKTITSGYDAYSSIPINSLYTAYPLGNFYHGVVSVNANAPWNTNMNTVTINNEYDLYSVLLHEAMHTLGFLSLIDAAGISKFGAANNYYARYDQFLKDYNGNPLLTTAAPSACYVNNLVYNPAISPLNTIMQSACINTTLGVNLTTCSVAAQYSSTNVSSSLYTPYCFEPPSSLSHFEDMCSYASFTTSCVPTATPGYNDLYYLMSNASYTGSCYVKRFMQQEEKYVLCDLGYTTANTITSTAVNATHAYTNCSPTATIVGNNDGYFNGVYTYSTSGSSITIPTNSILANDYPASGLTIGCWELIYNNATATLTAGTFTVDATPGQGLVILKYYPQNAAGQLGNATYVFVYFQLGSCPPSNGCDLVSDGGFESLAAGTSCGPLNSIFGPVLSCWREYLNGNYRFSTNCNSFGGISDLGVSTFYTTPPINSVNSSSSAVSVHAYDTYVSALTNTLVTSLVPGQTYQLSFWVHNIGNTLWGGVNGTGTINPSSLPAIITVASNTLSAFAPTLNFPSGLHTLASFTIPSTNLWTQVTNTFVYSASLAPAPVIVIGLDWAVTGTLVQDAFMDCLIDNVSIVPYPGPTFVLPQTTICAYDSYTNLAQYTSTVFAGNFSGTGITLSGGQYHFNSPPTLTVGSYPISFNYTTATGCPGSVGLNVVITNSNCCPSPGVAYTSSVLTSSLSGSYIFANNITIPNGSSATLTTGDFQFLPGVSITVDNGAHLKVFGSHLYACLETMWQGIVVNDGGRITLDEAANGNSNLVEDAVVAVDLSNHTNSNLNPILESRFTTYNKNLIGINISNYQRSSNTYSAAFSLNSNVFTCRNFTFSAVNWPQASINDLRSATNATTGLASPYDLLGVATATLKNPYAGEVSLRAIQLNSVGVSSGSNFYGVNLGSASSPTVFNLFDSHKYFIHATASNLRLENNVFQNLLPFPTSSVMATVYNSAVFSNAGGVMSNKLDMAASSYDVGNRFWNCVRGVDGYKLYNFTLDRSIFRSSQTSTNTTSLIGNTGVYMSTNRAQYHIVRNEFTNLRNGLLVYMTPGTHTLSAPCFTCATAYGIYATNMSVQQNTFSPGSGANTYMKRAVVISAVNQASWTVNNVTNISPFTLGIIASNNQISNVSAGITISGINGWRTSVEGNNIHVLPESYFGAYQRGIDLSNYISTANSYAHIKGNEVYSNGSSTVNPTTMIHTGFATGPAYAQPSVSCNRVHDANNGFVFEGPNGGASWLGNDMENLEKGMYLYQNGVIGTQGSHTTAAGNLWKGTWNGTNYSLYTYNSSASLSPIYIQSNTYPNTALNPWGDPYQLSYVTNTLAPIVSNSGSAYNCFAPTLLPNNPLIPTAAQYPGPNAFYIALTSLYRFLHQNDSLKASKTTLTGFYNNLAGSSVHNYVKVEDNLMAGDFIHAASALSAVSPTNAVEQNYFDYYTLYLNYAENDFEITNSGDSSNLKNLAELCPALDGACIYQARALYGVVYKEPINKDNCSSGGEERSARPIETLFVPQEILIYPNPAMNEVTIQGTVDNEVLRLEIIDLSGRRLMEKTIETKGFIATLDLNLMNGAYLIKITNGQHESTIKKLLISK